MKNACRVVGSLIMVAGFVSGIVMGYEKHSYLGNNWYKWNLTILIVSWLSAFVVGFVFLAIASIVEQNEKIISGIADIKTVLSENETDTIDSKDKSNEQNIDMATESNDNEKL